MKDADRELADALSGIANDFRPDELAYLATTTKVEGPFRDRLAFRLHQNYETSELLVAREWKRIDLAVLDRLGLPICLIELKAMYTYDALVNVKFFTSATSADEIKAQQHAEAGTSVYSLLLVTHLAGSVLPQFISLVKYSGNINKAVVRYGAAATVLEEAIKAIDTDLSARKVVARGRADGGTAFGLAVAVHYWLVRNDRPENSN